MTKMLSMEEPTRYLFRDIPTRSSPLDGRILTSSVLIIGPPLQTSLLRTPAIVERLEVKGMKGQLLPGNSHSHTSPSLGGALGRLWFLESLTRFEIMRSRVLDNIWSLFDQNLKCGPFFSKKLILYLRVMCKYLGHEQYSRLLLGNVIKVVTLTI